MKMKSFKGLALYAVICACCLSTASTASASSINVNNKPVEIAAGTYLKSGNTMVPMRVIAESLRATVNYNPGTKTATVTKGGVEIVVTAGSYQAKVDGKITAMTAAPEIKDGVFMVPLRFLAQSLSCEVLWDETTKTVQIKTQDGTETFSLTKELPPYMQSSADINLAEGLAPDGKTPIRKTNMPKYSQYFRYIQAGVPNWAYENIYKSWSNNLIAQLDGATRYPENPALSKVAYTPVDLQNEELYGTRFGDAFWNSVVDKDEAWKTLVLDNNSQDNSSNNVIGADDGIMTQEEMITNLVKQVTNVNYKDDTQWAYAVPIGNYMNTLSVSLTEKRERTVDLCNAYMEAQRRCNIDNKLITHSEFKVMKEAMWMASDSNMVSAFIPVYVKMTCDNFEPTKDRWRQFPFTTSAFNTDPALGDTAYTDIKKGETWEGVWQIELMYDTQSKLYKMNVYEGNIASQLSPNENIYSGVKPELDKTNEDTVYNISSVAEPIYMKRYKDM